MPKAEPGTPKWLANKMKAKGLQKLKWYCQMCEKQCRDENGFKCHRLSEAHQRQMQIFCQDANRFMDEYSSMFEKEFMRLMKTRFCRTRVLANTVYTQLIADKTHIHMNSTVWITLTDFIIYLGNTGKCKIEQTNKGWYIEYIDREKIEREKQYLERKKAEYSHEQLKEKKINDAIEDAKKKGKYIEPEYTGIEKKNDQKIIIDSLKIGRNATTTDIFRDGNKCKKHLMKPSFNILLKQVANKVEHKGPKKEAATKQGNPNQTEHPDTQITEIANSRKRPMSTLELLVLENEQKKKLKTNIKSDKIKWDKEKEALNKNQNQNQNQNQKSNFIHKENGKGNHEERLEMKFNEKNVNKYSGDFPNKNLDNPTFKNNSFTVNKALITKDMSGGVKKTDDVWICENIVVKVIDKQHKYYKKKGVIISTSNSDKKKCKLKMGDKEVCTAFQKQLQTVIPKIGRIVLVLKGKYKGYRATLEKIIMEDEMVEIVLDESNSGDIYRGITKRLSYDDISKLSY